jgi:hypothetical protein
MSLTYGSYLTTVSAEEGGLMDPTAILVGESDSIMNIRVIPGTVVAVAGLVGRVPTRIPRATSISRRKI